MNTVGEPWPWQSRNNFRPSPTSKTPDGPGSAALRAHPPAATASNPRSAANHRLTRRRYIANPITRSTIAISGKVPCVAAARALAGGVSMIVRVVEVVNLVRGFGKVGWWGFGGGQGLAACLDGDG